MKLCQNQKKNTIDPEEMIDIYGADSIRWFILSDSPPERDIQWSQEGVSAAYKFIQKLWKLNYEILQNKNVEYSDKDIVLKKAVNKTIYNVTKNLENFQYNVVVANIHEIYNILVDHISENKTSNKTLKNSWEKIIMLIMPLTPHLAHECSEKLNINFYWPKFDPNLSKNEDCTIVIQVDGKKRGIFKIPVDSDDNLVIKKAKTVDNVLKYIKGTEIIKNIYLKNKLINFITKK